MKTAFGQLCCILGALLMMTFISAPIEAQNAGDSISDPPGSCEHSPGLRRMRQEGPRHQRAREMMLSLKIWKLTEALEIDEKLAEKIYPRVRELEELRFQQLKDNQQANEELRAALEAKDLDLEVLKTLIGQIKKLRFQHAKTESDQLDTIFELLSLEQQAGFLLVEADFHQNIRRFLHNREGGFKEEGEPPPAPPIQ